MREELFFLFGVSNESCQKKIHNKIEKDELHTGSHCSGFPEGEKSI